MGNQAAETAESVDEAAVEVSTAVVYHSDGEVILEKATQGEES